MASPEVPSGTGEQPVCASDQLQHALAFAVTLLLRADCWPSLENNVTYFGFETPVNLLLSFALCWDMWGFPFGCACTVTETFD